MKDKAVFVEVPFCLTCLSDPCDCARREPVRRREIAKQEGAMRRAVALPLAPVRKRKPIAGQREMF